MGSRSVAVYRRLKRLYIVAEHQTQAGLWITSDFVFALTDATPDELESSIRLALSYSRNNLPNPATFSGVANPLLSAANVRTWSAFAKSARCVRVRQDADVITITPFKKGGAGGGFEAIQDRAVSLHFDTSIGVTVADFIDNVAR